jgi:hypothetical protein
MKQVVKCHHCIDMIDITDLNVGDEVQCEYCYQEYLVVEHFYAMDLEYYKEIEEI